MGSEANTYLSVLQDSLNDKLEVLKEIYRLSQEQEHLLQGDIVKTDQFDQTMNEKEKLIQKIQQLDQGFDQIYQKVSFEMKTNKHLYRSYILEMQNLIRVITEFGVKIQTLERKNKDNFARYLTSKKEDIRKFKISNKTAVSYYNNMSNQHHAWQSYFVDKKK